VKSGQVLGDGGPIPVENHPAKLAGVTHHFRRQLGPKLFAVGLARLLVDGVNVALEAAVAVRLVIVAKLAGVQAAVEPLAGGLLGSYIDYRFNLA